MKIIHVSAECYPIAKVGGLADVVGALPKYQNTLGHDASVIMPFYNIPFTQNNAFEKVSDGIISMDEKDYDYSILKPTSLDLGFDIFLVHVPDVLFKEYVYSNDDTERFMAFQIAALTWLSTQEVFPDVVHCHDHHTGLVPFMMQQCHIFNSFKKIPTVLSIHNAQYQGWFSHDKIDLIPEFNREHTGLLDWYGNINPLASAIKCAWRVNTVSPSYMEELKENANHLESLLSHEAEKCIGILNGIDTDVWDTKTDSYLIENYDLKSVQSGKQANKKWLCDSFELDETKPLFAFIGRLVYEKGSDLFPEAFEQVLNNQDVSILLLGSGEQNTEERLLQLKEKYQGKFNAFIGYDEKLSHIIYAGADFLLMPSRVEPCGLNQMYSLRYGTIPVVRSIGGLKDTIVDVEDGGFGFTHEDTTVEQIVSTVSRARQLFEDQKEFKKITKQIMQIDHSWNRSAMAYIQMYKSITN
ncbi:starch synthase [Nonlabens dokdonensis]|jgi:starch synthase|uniref:Glycogen synthase n=2 Tax=Nonlabens dokdonensis TaxID=328515 RepID=L7W6U4_NONDD|nr:glycogen synthase [Nonlabens dokdonensis]AGC75917.1 glycogen synthase [Nonlabens dokdonensis DSW-6]PZX43597.1 starch synthase [Nonlabens dokdonensis]